MTLTQLHKRLNEVQKSLIERVIGGVDTFERYHGLCGEIRGIEQAIQLMKEEVEEDTP